MKLTTLKFPGSLRWRLQLWHGLLLTLVLAGFGWTAWSLQRESLFTRVDQELEQRIHPLVRSLHLDRPPPPRDQLPGPPDEFPPPPEAPDQPPPGGSNLPRNNGDQIDESGDHSSYAIVWGRDGREIYRSRFAPNNISAPESAVLRPTTRMRGDVMESYHLLPSGELILCGKNVHGELASLQSLAWMLAAAGGVVLLLGLGMGALITMGALRPLVSIAATARKIAEGDLSQRIPVPNSESEISDLVRVLNQTFTRLDASFARQVQFTSDASHELRTPISVVLTHTQNALARERTTEEYRESLGACQRAARRMRQLTESLLALARLDNGDQGEGRTPCRLDQIACDVIELLTPLATEQRITLNAELEPVACTGNPEQLTQVVVNLVSNAIRYNSAGGMVVIKTGTEPGCVVLSIRDTGQGIAREEIPHLFERFYRADKARSGNASGAGLGLAITEAIVKAHGGTIEVTSELGTGSLFTVRLPA